MNVVIMRGTLSRDPEMRALPSGDTLLSFDLTTRQPDDAATSAPVVWFGAPEAGASLRRGDDVVVVGSVRRRFFRTGGTTQSRTEVVAQRVVPVRQVKRSQAAVDQAIARVAEALAAEPGT